MFYNHCIALHKRYYRLFKKYLKLNDLQKHTTKLKKTHRYAFLKPPKQKSQISLVFGMNALVPLGTI
ncbi:hypothetical protein ACM23_06655 [Helicobacter pylori]|nr:hypothetical protein ACM23_06655 [Helicobacter pylori]